MEVRQHEVEVPQHEVPNMEVPPFSGGQHGGEANMEVPPFSGGRARKEASGRPLRLQGARFPVVRGVVGRLGEVTRTADGAHLREASPSSASWDGRSRSQGAES